MFPRNRFMNFRNKRNHTNTNTNTNTNVVEKNNRNISEIIMDCFKENEIEKIFGVTGGMAYLMLKSLPESIEFVSTGNELHDTFAAQQYGRDKNKVGIVFVTSGPGLWNATSAILQSYRDGNPLLVITGYNSKWTEMDFQAYNLLNISKQISQYYYFINKKNMHYTKNYINKLYNYAVNHKSVCFLAIDKEIQMAIPPYIVGKSNCDRDTLNSINYQKLLISSYLSICKKPLLLIGSTGLTEENIKTIKLFCSHNNIPIVTTSRGRGIKPDLNHNFKNYGHIGTLGKYTANYAIVNCDLLIIIGLVAGEENEESFFPLSRLTGGIIPGIVKTYNTFIISIAPDKRFNLSQSNISLEADNITKMLENVKINNCFLCWINQLKNAYSKLKVADFTSMTCGESLLDRYCKIFSQTFKEKKLKVDLVSDVGNHWYSIQKYFNPESYNKFEISIRWGHIGCSLPMAYGKYLANNKPLWVVAGDGGTTDALGMISFCINQQEMGINIPITMFIFVDGYYSAVVAGYEIINAVNENNVDKLKLKNNPYISTVQIPKVDFKKLVPDNMLTIINNPNELSKFIKKNNVSNKFQVVLLTINENNDIKNMLNSSVKVINFSNEMETALRNDDFETIKKIPLVLKSDMN